MPDDSLRDRIAAVLKARWPAPWFGGESQSQQVTDLVDALLVELDLGIPCARTGCKMRLIARRHAKASELSDDDHRVDVTWVAPGTVAKMLGETDE